MKSILRNGTVAVALTFLAVACGDGGGEVDPIRVAGYRVWIPGPLVERYPPDPHDLQAEDIVEGGLDLAVGVGEGEGIYVLDAGARHVLRLDGDATLQAVIGRPGGGPGELGAPVSIEADLRGGVWVADRQHHRLSRFDSDGELLEETPVPSTVRGFTVLPNGTLLYRKFENGVATLALHSGRGAVDLAADLPAELAPQDLASYLAEYDLEFAVLAPDTVIAFRNSGLRAYGAWRMALDTSSARITDIARVPMPVWLSEAIRAQAEEIEASAPERAEGIPPSARRSIIPFSRGARMASGDFWIVPHVIGGTVTATTIPLLSGDSVTIVLRSRPLREIDRCNGKVDYAVFGERLAMLCSDELRVYALQRVEPERLPFDTNPADG